MRPQCILIQNKFYDANYYYYYYYYYYYTMRRLIVKTPEDGAN
jgi:hypothetical protein